jgi:hypothetical protein
MRQHLTRKQLRLVVHSISRLVVKPSGRNISTSMGCFPHSLHAQLNNAQAIPQPVTQRYAVTTVESAPKWLAFSVQEHPDTRSTSLLGSPFRDRYVSTVSWLVANYARNPPADCSSTATTAKARRGSNAVIIVNASVGRSSSGDQHFAQPAAGGDHDPKVQQG